MTCLGDLSKIIPARLALPKCPKPYQTESTKAWSDEQLKSLLGVVTRKANTGNVVGLRDRALLLFYVTTGMRRNEVIALCGSDIEARGDGMIVWARVKGGDYTGREVNDPSVRAALTDHFAVNLTRFGGHPDKTRWYARARRCSWQNQKKIHQRVQIGGRAARHLRRQAFRAGRLRVGQDAQPAS